MTLTGNESTELSKFNASSDYVSFSRLDAYSKCSEYYRHKYIDKTQYNKTSNKYFLLGDLVHKCIEYIIENDLKSNKIAILNIFPNWLINNINHNDLEFNTEDIFTVGFSYGELIHKCSEGYVKEDKIRNKDGSILKDPFNAPSKNLTEAIKELGRSVNVLKYNLDIYATSKDIVWQQESFTNFLAEAVSIILNFNLPYWFSKSIGIEYPISTSLTNIIQFTPEFKLKGYIDWIIESTDGHLIICDHKTSSKKLAPEDVMTHPQLNIYGYVIKELLGRYPDALCIHHARSNTYTLAEFDLEIAEGIVGHYKNICSNIIKESFIKKHPGDFNTPCLTRDWKTGLVKNKCEYLSECWSIYNNLI